MALILKSAIVAASIAGASLLTHSTLESQAGPTATAGTQQMAAADRRDDAHGVYRPGAEVGWHSLGALALRH